MYVAFVFIVRTEASDHDVSLRVHCPARCANAYHRVYGTSVYRGVCEPLVLSVSRVLHRIRLFNINMYSVCVSSQDSNICAAAIHAGVVLNDNGGDCTLLKAAGQNFYPGSRRNGITSLQ